MFGIRGRKSLLIVAGLLGLFFIFSVFVAPRINPPGPTVHTSLIFAGGVSRTIVGSKEPKVGRPGTFVPPYQPHFSPRALRHEIESDDEIKRWLPLARPLLFGVDDVAGQRGVCAG